MKELGHEGYVQCQFDVDSPALGRHEIRRALDNHLMKVGKLSNSLIAFDVDNFRSEMQLDYQNGMVYSSVEDFSDSTTQLLFQDFAQTMAGHFPLHLKVDEICIVKCENNSGPSKGGIL